jgi:hypothetical protein
MYKVANQIIDAYDDVHKVHLEKIAADYPNCKILSAEKRASLPADAYGVTLLTKEGAQHKFPLCDQDQTWLSQEMLSETSHRMPEGMAKVAAHFIKRACEVFGVPVKPETEALRNLSLKTASAKDVDLALKTGIISESKAGEPIGIVTKQASVKDALSPYADLDSFCSNYTSAQYAMPSQSHVKLAAAYFEEKNKKMPLELRHKYAAHVQIRAGELGMQPIKGEISKYASDRYSAMLGAHITNRSRILEGTPFVAELQKIASMKEQLTPYQFAQALNEFDKKAGLSKYHDVSLENPFRATFAAEVSTPWSWKSTKFASRELTAEELSKLVNTQSPKIAEYLGKEVADGLKSHTHDVFNSLPNDAKEIMGQIHEGLL